jgi:hypothetical protein
MTSAIHGASSTQSLALQIEAAERRILHRRRSLGVHSAGLIRCIHDRLISPDLLWWAAGLGFLLGEVTRDKVEASPTSVQSLGRMIATWTPLMRVLLTVDPPVKVSQGSSQPQSPVDDSGSSPDSSLATPR